MFTRVGTLFQLLAIFVSEFVTLKCDANGSMHQVGNCSQGLLKRGSCVLQVDIPFRVQYWRSLVVRKWLRHVLIIYALESRKICKLSSREGCVSVLVCLCICVRFSYGTKGGKIGMYLRHMQQFGVQTWPIPDITDAMSITAVCWLE